MAVGATLAVTSRAFALAAGAWLLIRRPSGPDIAEIVRDGRDAPNAMRAAFDAALVRHALGWRSRFVESGPPAHMPEKLVEVFAKARSPWFRKMLRDPERMTFGLVGLTSCFYVAAGTPAPVLGGEDWNFLKILFGASLGAASMIKLLDDEDKPSKGALRPNVAAAGLFSVPMVALLADGLASNQILTVLAGLLGLADNAVLAFSREKLLPRPNNLEELAKYVESHRDSVAARVRSSLVWGIREFPLFASCAPLYGAKRTWIMRGP